MKAANIPITKSSRSNKSIQKKIEDSFLKSRYKDQTFKRQQNIVNANAGHVRGGHSFH